MKLPTKKYIVWTHDGGSAYTPTEFDTVEEALIEPKYTADWYLTESVNGLYASTRFNAPTPHTEEKE